MNVNINNNNKKEVTDLTDRNSPRMQLRNDLFSGMAVLKGLDNNYSFSFSLSVSNSWLYFLYVGFPLKQVPLDLWQNDYRQLQACISLSLQY